MDIRARVEGLRESGIVIIILCLTREHHIIFYPEKAKSNPPTPRLRRTSLARLKAAATRSKKTAGRWRDCAKHPRRAQRAVPLRRQRQKPKRLPASLDDARDKFRRPLQNLNSVSEDRVACAT